MTNTLTTVEIPADVRDNSQKVMDYAFMSHLSPHPWKHTKAARESALLHAHTFGYRVHTWHDVNPDGQRCRFDMLVNRRGLVVHLFHTEYFTRANCADCEYSYASVFQTLTDTDGNEAGPVGRCDEHARRFRRSLDGLNHLTLHESERLRIGQHDD